jgi:catechol 2,3-dioxygenase-like lactoylglutathione lyase family enzyme
MSRPTHGTLHHVELWVPDLQRALASFGWLLQALGYAVHQSWNDGRSWRLGPTYLVIEQSPALTAERHDRCRPGLNHLAFHVEDATAVEKLAADAAEHGWQLMFPERHPYAGGGRHYAAYLENDDGFEVELVAINPTERN